MAVARSTVLKSLRRNWTLNEFATRLLNWFDEYGRKDFPWQKNTTAYRVWVSEIMLQQTQVQTVIPYFDRFVERFPTLESLASASQDDVLSHWTGLGYYARARNLHKAAQRVLDMHGGQFPISIDDVMALPGIGRSTAGAVLSLAYGRRHAILDGNVKRVLARHRALAGWPGKASVAGTLWEAAEKNTPVSRVADYTQAIMDLGATLCTRSHPLCGRCPVAADCIALKTQSVDSYPGRKPKSVKPVRTTTMVLASLGGRVYLERRPESGIWGGLWSLPELGERTLDDWCVDTFGNTEAEILSWAILRHSFSHFDLDIQPILVRFKSHTSKVAESDAETWYRLDGVPPGGFSAPVKKLIDQLKKSENVAYR